MLGKDSFRRHLLAIFLSFELIDVHHKLKNVSNITWNIWKTQIKTAGSANFLWNILGWNTEITCTRDTYSALYNLCTLVGVTKIAIKTSSILERSK